MAYLILENEEYSPDSEGYSYYDFNPNDESSLRAIELALANRKKDGNATREYLSELCTTSLSDTDTVIKRILPGWIRSLLSSLKSTGRKTVTRQRKKNRISLPKNPSGHNRKLSFS